MQAVSSNVVTIGAGATTAFDRPSGPVLPTEREVGMLRGISLRLVLRQLVVASAVAWAVALLGAVVWSAFTERSVGASLPVAAVIVGVVFLVSGGGALSALGADPDPQSELRLTAGPLPADQEAERPVGLAPLGLNLLVSPQLIIGGFLLAG